MVNWEAVGAIAEVLGALAVVVSLIYLGSQVKQANVQAQGVAYADWFVGWNDTIKGWIGDRETIEALQQGFDDFDSLSKVDQAVFAQQLAALINQWHLASDLTERGLIQESLRAAVTDLIVSVCSTQGGRTYLERYSSGFPRGAELMHLVQSSKGRLPPFTALAPWWSLAGVSAEAQPE